MVDVPAPAIDAGHRNEPRPRPRTETPDREQRLITRQDSLRRRIRLINLLRSALAVIAVPIVCVTLFWLYDLRTFTVGTYQYIDQENRIVGGMIIGGPFLLIGLMLSPESRRRELIDVSNELDLVSIPSISYEQKAQKLLQIQQLELKRYYMQTLHQSAYIFWVGVAAMIIGIAVIVGTIYYIHDSSEHISWDEKVIVGIVGAIGGILTNFVGAMYIKMFSEIVRGVTHSQDALVTMNHLHLANLFIADISDKELREKTLSDLALALKTSLARPMEPFPPTK